MENIYLAPISFSNQSLLNKIFFELNKIFNSRVVFIKLDLNVSTAHSKERNQFYSTKIISEAIPLTKEINGKVLILVDFDLFIPIFTFIFGEAQLNGKHSIISLCRLHEEFYTGKTNEDLLIERTIKEILHELGHNFGLLHCTNWDCVMHSSTSIEEVDIKGKDYCNKCKSAF